MSWDIDIVDEDGYTMKCEKEHKMIGGTVRCDENLKQIPVTDATLKLGTEPHQDYWAATMGNAGKALENILFLCEQCPSGKIRIW